MDRRSFFEGFDRVLDGFNFETDQKMLIATHYKQLSSSKPFKLEDSPLGVVIGFLIRCFPVVRPGVEPTPRPEMEWDKIAGLANLLSVRRVWDATNIKEHYFLIGKAFEEGCKSDPNYRLILERMEKDLNN